MNEQFVFDIEKHKYFLGAEEIPGVSTILKKFFFTPKDDDAMQRGSNIHLAIQLWDDKELDEEQTDQAYMPYIQGWEKFKKQEFLGGLPLISEVSIVERSWRYAGTIDKIFIKNHSREVFLIDLKTGAINTKHDEVQLFGYGNLVMPVQELAKTNCIFNGREPEEWFLHPDPYTIQMVNVYLDGHGSYRIEQRKYNRRNVNLFLSYLTVFNHQGGIK